MKPERNSSKIVMRPTYGQFVSLAIAVHVLAASGRPAELTITTNVPPGSPLAVAPGEGASPMLVMVVNGQPSDDAAAFMTGWQTTLQVIPDPGSTGVVAFSGATEPADYVFSTTETFGIETSIGTAQRTNDTLVAFDFNAPYSAGVSVPDSPGAALLSIDLSTSPDAAGPFGVFALTGFGQTVWTDASSPTSLQREFVNLAQRDQPVRVGEILVQPDHEPPDSTPLQAGDADRDFDFDQWDIVQVLRPQKYLTGQPASWGEGDWNGAPGGTRDDPPVGDNRFDQLDLIAALKANVYLTGPYSSLAPEPSHHHGRFFDVAGATSIGHALRSGPGDDSPFGDLMAGTPPTDTVSPGAMGGPIPVPEPTTFLLMLLATLALPAFVTPAGQPSCVDGTTKARQTPTGQGSTPKAREAFERLRCRRPGSRHRIG